MLFRFSSTASVLSLRLSKTSCSSEDNRSISPSIRSTFCWWKFCCCSIFSTSTSHSDTCTDCSDSSLRFSSSSAVKPLICCSTFFSSCSESCNSCWISCLLRLISWIWVSISRSSFFNSIEPSEASFLRSSALMTFSLAVFCSMNFFCNSALSSSRLKRNWLRSCLVFSMSSNSSSTCFKYFFTFSFSSSISRRRPRRLLLFLNAPPLMAPPGTKSSPSSVTIRIP